MQSHLILASGSQICADLLRNAGVTIDVIPARIDEDALRKTLLAGSASPRDIADALAEGKARKISMKHPDRLVLGCDQIAEIKGDILTKPGTKKAAIEQIRRLSGQQHRLLSAAVLYHNGQPVWRHVGQVRLQMRKISEEYLQNYMARNWHSIRHSVGGYKLEEEGVRLFSRVEGDYFNVLGLPLIELLSYLTERGALKT